MEATVGRCPIKLFRKSKAPFDDVLGIQLISKTHRTDAAWMSTLAIFLPLRLRLDVATTDHLSITCQELVDKCYEPKWVHGKRAIVEPSRMLTAQELKIRICQYFDCPLLNRLQ